MVSTSGGLLPYCRLMLTDYIVWHVLYVKLTQLASTSSFLLMERSMKATLDCLLVVTALM